jgi:hypothetical protein
MLQNGDFIGISILTFPCSTLENWEYALSSSASMTEEYPCTTFQIKYVCKTSFEVLDRILDKLAI